MSNRLPFVVRQSLLEQAQCLHHLHENHIMGIKDPDGEFAVRGRDFHELAKKYVDFLVASAQSSDWDYARELVETGDWNHEATTIFDAWARESQIEHEQVLATEMKIRLNADFEVCDQEDAVYSGDLDRVDIIGQNQAKIVDYKTFFGITGVTSIQSSFYPWLLFKAMPHLESVEFELEFVRFGAVRRGRTDGAFTRADMPRLEKFVSQQVSRLVDAHKGNEWPAAINTGCAYCRLACPLVAGGLSRSAIGQVGDEEQATAMMQELFALTRSAAQIKLALKGWATAMGPIVTENDMTLGFARTQKWTLQPRDIHVLNVEHGFDPLRALKVDNQAIKQIARKYPEYVERAQTTGKNQSSTTFRFWNAKGDPIMDLEDEGQ